MNLFEISTGKPISPTPRVNQGSERSDDKYTLYHKPKSELVAAGLEVDSGGQYIPPGGPCIVIDGGGAYRDPNTVYTTIDGGGAVQDCGSAQQSGGAVVSPSWTPPPQSGGASDCDVEFGSANW